MPAQDMLDVVHYCFETDSINEKEVHDAKRKMRGVVYNRLYQRPYTWGSDDEGTSHEFGTQELASGDVFNSSQLGTPGTNTNGPQQLTHKPYVPPTPVDPTSPKPYGTVLDAPLG